jgi:hypothetical protein
MEGFIKTLPLFQRGIEGDFCGLSNSSKPPISKGRLHQTLPLFQRGIEGD